MAQILKIIGVFATIIGLAITVVGVSEMDLTMAGGGAIAALAGLVISIIALILNIVGLNTAKKDETNFSNAFVMTLIALAISVISAFVMSANPPLGSWMKFFSTLLELLAFEYVVRGVIVLADNLHDKGMADFGRKMRILITIGYFAVLVIDLWGNSTTDVGSVITLVGSIIELVVYVMYVIFLARTKKMLA